MEQKLKQLIGELHFAILGLQFQNEELQKKIKELEEPTNG
jgi:hypothetical protein